MSESTTSKQKPVIGEGVKTSTPKQVAARLAVDPKQLRRVARALWGTHYERWAITPAMEKELKKALKK